MVAQCVMACKVLKIILIHLIYALSGSIGYIVMKSTVLILIFSRLVLVVWIVGLCFVGVLMVVVQSYIENLMLHVLHRFHHVLNAFVVLKFSILYSGLSHLLISLYMPAACHSSSFVDYLNTLGELQGFLESQQCDVNILVGDFNVDFDRCSSLTRLLRDFMSEMSLHACDLSFHSSVKFTFERGDGLARSWIDHILCSKPFSTLVTNVHTLFPALVYLITFHFASYSKFIA